MSPELGDFLPIGFNAEAMPLLSERRHVRLSESERQLQSGVNS
jgi:hypothetical protein